MSHWPLPPGYNFPGGLDWAEGIIFDGQYMRCRAPGGPAFASSYWCRDCPCWGGIEYDDREYITWKRGWHYYSSYQNQENAACDSYSLGSLFLDLLELAGRGIAALWRRFQGSTEPVRGPEREVRRIGFRPPGEERGD